MSADTTVYRVLSPALWDRSVGKALPTAFQLRPSDEDGLSVFAAEVITPDGLLQVILGERSSTLADDPRRLEKWLRKNGRSPAEMRASGWAVAALPLSVFSDQGFLPGPVEPDGHISIKGSPEAFERFSVLFAERAALTS